MSRVAPLSSETDQPRRRLVDRAEASLRLGSRTIGLSTAKTYSVSQALRRDRTSALMTMGSFAVVALLACVAVLDFGVRTSLLLTAATFGLIAISALDDLWRSGSVAIYTLDVLLGTGERIRYVTPDQKDMLRIMDVFGRAGVERVTVS